MAETPIAAARISASTACASRTKSSPAAEARLPESELRLRVQERIKEGRLPVEVITLINGGFGGGQTCAVCDTPVTRDKVKYDVVDPRNADQLIFHFACYVIWQRECARRIRAGDSRR